MRYMLLLHGREAEFQRRTPDRREAAVAFLARFEDELAVGSELEWTEVLDDEEHAVLVGPGGTGEGWFNSEGSPLQRAWVVRVQDRERALELAARLARGVDSPVEVRKCLPGAQRP
ncbi:YciI family protein [Leucobacter sp. wl10]|uniref:YciI family protein n=1 Tax=Leucobacter sp. wl10 TaxID=2304677 RepID=UPI000E5AC024|nr:YciI family protein [Leucobacter sp. wl10]RGE20774.1 hypothetical protein D1J51_08620 [Leucobacter sp. wl10]